MIVIGGSLRVKPSRSGQVGCNSPLLIETLVVENLCGK